MRIFLARRNMLKAGFLAISSGVLPLSPMGKLTESMSALGLIGRHRWLALSDRNADFSEATPPISRAAKPLRHSPVHFWVGVNLELVKKYRLNPLRAARTFSYLAVALHEVTLSCRERYGDDLAHSTIGIHFIAGRMLEYLFPEEVRGKWTAEAILLASAHAAPGEAKWASIWNLAGHTANAVIDLALTDGSARINALVQPPKNIELVWKAAPPLWSSRPAEPGAPNWRTWLVPSSVGDQCAPPLTLNPAKYADEIRLVYDTHENLSTSQKKIAEDWNLDLGTVTPPGVWLMKATEDPGFLRMSLTEQTGVLSLLTTTMLDSFSACWRVKFTWWTERPITAIRRLHDPQFLPHVATPSFPSYTSGHASVSGAAATILSAALPERERDWEKAAQEAADSRLYGGIHFSFDNEEGLALGRKVGKLALAGVRERSKSVL